MSRSDDTSREVFAEGVWLHETEKAHLVEFPKAGKCWLPKSQMKKELEILDVETQDCVVFIPLWIAEKSGIDYTDPDEVADAQEGEEYEAPF